MKFKEIFKKIIKPKNKKVESDNSYCYSKLIWNTPNNIIILISFTEDYFGDIIDLQDAINYRSNLTSKIVYSSYEEETDKLDEDGDRIIIIHKKYYILIGGAPSAWEILYMSIHNLGNRVLSKISKEITNNCNPEDFNTLLQDGVLPAFTSECNYDTPKATKGRRKYTDPEILLSRLPDGFTGRDILKFIKIRINHMETDAYNAIPTYEDNREYPLYELYASLFKNPTAEKLRMLVEPLYKQPDDDSMPGDISDESLDELFKEKYERFSALNDDSIEYEDIDEIIDEEENYISDREDDDN